MTEKTVYLMRGLPSCGKSHTARKLAGERGVVCETDAYFYTQVSDDPTTYDYRNDLLEVARQWNFARFRQAVDAGMTPIVVDRGNSLSIESQLYARYAVEHGYAVELQEPESPWWQEIRVLLKYKRYTKPVLYLWAERLAQLSQSTHRVSVKVIRRRMGSWKYDLTVEDILAYDPKKAVALRNGSAAIRSKSRQGGGKGVTASTPLFRGSRKEDLKEKPRKGQNKTGHGLAASNPWVGDFLLNMAANAGAMDPNKDIRVAVGGDTDGD